MCELVYLSHRISPLFLAKFAGERCQKTVRENKGNLQILPIHREFGLLKL